ncbi:GntR family transcriptional regulator [bacterium]|nr:GntR family transcriptional regulator [bacterium]
MPPHPRDMRRPLAHPRLLRPLGRGGTAQHPEIRPPVAGRLTRRRYVVYSNRNRDIAGTILNRFFYTMTFSHINPVSLRDQVVEQVRKAIIEGRLLPEDRITEAALTRELGVSRTPVREALILLQGEGLITYIPNRGAFVRSFDAERVEHIFSTRCNLENFTAELVINRLTEADFIRLESLIERQRQAMADQDWQAARSRDVDFHWHLVQRSEHAYLQRLWRELVAQVAALLHLRARGLPYDEYQVITDHQAIVAAYRSRDLAAVQDLNRRINDRVAEECRVALSQLKHG